MPDEADVLPQHIRQDVRAIAIAIGTGEDDDAPFHEGGRDGWSSSSYRYSSMTVLASSVSHMALSCFLLERDHPGSIRFPKTFPPGRRSRWKPQGLQRLLDGPALRIQIARFQVT